MLVVSRFRVPVAEAPSFRILVESAHATLARQHGYVEGWVGRNLDDPQLWTLTTRWQHVGAYRRALSTYDVKLTAVPVLGRAVDEPSAYEVVEPDRELNRSEPRGTG